MFAGLDPGDRQVLEQKYSGSDPPCLLDSSDGRWAGVGGVGGGVVMIVEHPPQVRTQGPGLQPDGRAQLPDDPARLQGAPAGETPCSCVPRCRASLSREPCQTYRTRTTSKAPGLHTNPPPSVTYIRGTITNKQPQQEKNKIWPKP